MKTAKGWIGSSQRRLRLSLGLFFVALAIPTAFLIRHTYQQLKWESYYQHRNLAEELVTRVDSRFRQLLSVEDARPRSDYGFLSLSGDPAAHFVVRSPLSAYPVRSGIPGVLGYFQIDEQGDFSTPLLPPAGTDPRRFGITAKELSERAQLDARLGEILAANGLWWRPEVRAQTRAPYRRRMLRVPGPWPFGLDSRIPGAEFSGPHAWPDEDEPDDGLLGWPDEPPGPRRSARHERSAVLEAWGLPDEDVADPTDFPQRSQLRVVSFEGDIDPPTFRRIASGHFLISRRVWRDGRSTVQGVLIDPDRFLRVLVERDFRQAAISRMSDLLISQHGAPILKLASNAPATRFGNNDDEWNGRPLLRAELSPPFNELTLTFSIASLPAGSGTMMVGWLAGIIAAVLCGGLWVLYRLGLRQIAATRQQQDFISAVSHELKTPLTSIRMHGEMLREGWVSDERKAASYEFICSESDRLSRLIGNVLDLARMTRGNLALRPSTLSAGQLIRMIEPRIASQIERAGFMLRIAVDERAAATLIRADEDGVSQIAINLVDNALKFGGKALVRRIEILCYRHGERALVIGVRDFGPGIPEERIGKIFRPFYRGEDEQVRETTGTGIGLALVQQLAAAMQAEIDVVNREPGAEFRLWFKCIGAETAFPPGAAPTQATRPNGEVTGSLPEDPAVAIPELRSL